MPRNPTYPGKPGDVAVHRSGDVVVLGRRKTGVDASPLPGWWLRDRNGGLADRALDGPDWCLVDGKELFALLQLGAEGVSSGA